MACQSPQSSSINQETPIHHSTICYQYPPPPFHQVIDTQIRQALKTILTNRNIDHVGHGFHTFRRLGATLAYDHSVPLQNIMSHGLWRSSTVWIYLQNASQAPSIIPTTFSSIVPKHL